VYSKSFFLITSVQYFSILLVDFPIPILIISFYVDRLTPMRWLELLFTKDIEIQYKKKLCDAGYLFHIVVGLFLNIKSILYRTLYRVFGKNYSY